MQHYYESFETDEGWGWKVYHYDPSGNREIVDAMGDGFDDDGKAEDACAEWMDENEIDADLS